MKLFGKLWFLILYAVIVLISCSKKNITTPDASVGNSERKVQYAIYTDKDFSNENGNIVFSLLVFKDNRVVFDSALAVMRVKDIPAINNKILVEKIIPASIAGQLTIGIRYDLENVGYKYTLDTYQAGTNLKVFNYNFH